MVSAPDIGSPSHSFFAVGDHQNLRRETTPRPLTSTDVRLALNFQLLFSARLFLIAEDMLVNEHLMHLLLDEYRDVLTSGLFVPMLRTSYDSIADCRLYLEAQDYYNQTGTVVWKESLSRIVTMDPVVGRYDEAAAYEHFTEVARFYLGDQALLRDLEIDVPASEISSGVDTICRETGRSHWRRSALYHFADSVALRGHARDARKLRQLASVVYMAHFAGLFEQVGLFPQWYRPIVSRLTALDIDGINAGVETPSPVSQLERVLPNSRLEDVGHLTWEDIAFLRETREFHEYTLALESHASARLAPTDPIVRAISSYLEEIDRYVAEKRSGVRRNASRTRKSLGLVRKTLASGAVLAIADITLGGPTLLEPPVSLAVAGTGLAFLISERQLASRLSALEQERARYWNAYCAPEGTFAAQISKLTMKGTSL